MLVLKDLCSWNPPGQLRPGFMNWVNSQAHTERSVVPRKRPQQLLSSSDKWSNRSKLGAPGPSLGGKELHSGMPEERMLI